ncbi:MAG: S24/S26 family peptidase [Clostridia bacterium]|nr:S24/S26 family peptidase [Clostridia bacterium]
MNNQNAEQILEKTGVYSAISKGTSMWPMLGDGTDRIIVAKCDTEPELYDVALFRRESGILVLHRIVKIHTDHYLFCGDNQNFFEKVKKEQVLGILKGYYKGKKYTDCKKSRSYRLYVRLWTKTLPRRKELLVFMWTLVGIKNKIKRIFRKK